MALNLFPFIWKIGGVIVPGGDYLPIIKSPVHNSIHSPLFLRKIVRIEDSVIRAAILDR